MIYYRCKCGDCVSYGSMPPYPCSGCYKCKTTLSTHPDRHETLRPHVLVPFDVEEDDGLGILHKCKWCLATKKQIEAEIELWEFEPDHSELDHLPDQPLNQDRE